MELAVTIFIVLVAFGGVAYLAYRSSLEKPMPGAVKGSRTRHPKKAEE